MTTTDNRPETAPLFPQGVSDEYDEWHTTRDDGPLVQTYGHCASWCNDDRAQTSGLTVTEHGDYCEAMIGAAEARNGDGSRAGLYVELHQPYLHGTYRREEIYGRMLLRDPLVAVGPGHDEERPVYLTLGEARRLAAALLRAADVGDGLDRDFNGSTQRRRTEP